MTSNKFLVTTALALFVTATAWAKTTKTWNFEKTQAGKIPAGWKVETTNSRGKDAKWQVKKDKSAPSGHHTLTLTNPKGNYGSTFNLCWTDTISFKDGEITVKFRANTGSEDEGGGIMWRVKDKNNYYVARFNPLEDNFRLYYVKNGHRRMLLTARVHLSAHKWHSMRIVQQGDRFTAYLDGKKYLDGRDSTFKNAGGVGLWTKADAATSFDDFSVTTK